MSTAHPGLRKILFCLGATVLGVLLFAGAFPNLLFENGLPLLAWIAYVPVFWLTRQVGLGASVCWGALYGYAAYGLFNYWLGAFHPLAGLIVGVIYLVYFALLFPLLKLALILFPKRGYVLQWILWLSFEYLKTQGFLGYSYGITGYSQWRLIPVIQIADLFGVWGVSALTVFPSTYLAAALEGFPDAGMAKLRDFFHRERLAACVWGLCLAASLVYGFVSQTDYTGSMKARLALIQHNTDPWQGGLEQYRKNYETLRRLSDEAMQEEPKPDLVVWSETAFVPRIYWHVTYRDDPGSYTLVRELLDYLGSQDLPFVIGNDDGRKEPEKNPDAGEDYRVDYNAVILFDKGEFVRSYRKIHLVPFTEYFPYRKEFPGIYRFLKNADTHFWEKGTEATVFECKGIKFSAPICFEDTFGYLSSDFVQNGAELLINLSNDAWSQSLPAQMQHLSMSVFRAVENRRSMARSTSSGQTCGIDPNGRILAMARPFVETQLTVALPISREQTLYTRFGDTLPRLFVAAGGILLLIGAALAIMKRTGASGPKGRTT
jgi:apolipoprotein N-acyltransferase